MPRVIYQTECELEELKSAGIDFTRALRIIKNFMGIEDTLDALQGFEKRYSKAEVDALETDDYDFDHDWRYEVYSYNLLVEGFGKLFAPKKA